MGRNKTHNTFFTPEEIEILKTNPNVKTIRSNRIAFTYEFRCRMFEWYVTHHEIRQFLENNGISPQMIGSHVIGHLTAQFRSDGHPINGSGSSIPVTVPKLSEEEIQQLIDAGVFVRARNGIRYSEEFLKEALNSYPEKNLVTLLKDHGVDANRIGYQRVRSLKRFLEDRKPVPVKVKYSDSQIDQLKRCPWVKKITPKILALRSGFYECAYLIRDCPISDVLEVFSIPTDLVTTGNLIRIRYKLLHWKPDRYRRNAQISLMDDETVKKLCQLMEKNNRKDANDLKDRLRSVSPAVLQSVYNLIHDQIKTFPVIRGYSISSVCRLFGISRSRFYRIRTCIPKDRYASDKEDIERIRRVIKYRGYPKGTRMVTMMMPKVEKVIMNRKKVQRLMRKAGLLCKIRAPRKSKAAARAQLEKNRKDNVLKRRFRLGKPYDQITTDVTYIKDCHGNTSYHSPIKDCVSGLIVASAVSDTQDLQLTDKMLGSILEDEGSIGRVHEGTLFHSDQGALYLTDACQKKLKEMGFVQSMSRRGNCWDNASMESFFGHMKDEVDFSKLRNTFEIQMKIDDYIDYYNFERPQWNRGKKTPAAFAVYLNNLSDEEYQAYLAREQEKYDRMMAKSAEKARKHAVDLGSVIPSKS